MKQRKKKLQVKKAKIGIFREKKTGVKGSYFLNVFFRTLLIGKFVIFAAFDLLFIRTISK